MSQLARRFCILIFRLFISHFVIGLFPKCNLKFKAFECKNESGCNIPSAGKHESEIRVTV